MRIFHWPRHEPRFSAWVTMLCVVLLLAGAAAMWIGNDEPLDSEPGRIYIAALHELREEFVSRPRWQRLLTGELNYQNYEKEILRVFELIRHPEDPTLEVQYAISLLAFGRNAEALDVLDAIEDMDYEETVLVLRGLAGAETDLPQSDDVEFVEWMMEESDSWWSRQLGSILAKDGLIEAPPSASGSDMLWHRGLWIGAVDWCYFGVLVLLTWSLRGAHHVPVYSGIAAGFGANAGNGPLLAALLRGVFLFLLLSTLGYLVVYSFTDDPPYLVLAMVDLVCRMSPAVLFMLWFFPSWKISVRAMGLEWGWLRRPSMWFWVCLGLLVTWVSNWIWWIGSNWMGGVDPSDFVDVALAEGGWEVLMFQLFVAGIVAPVSEELIFRGVLFRAWARRYGPWLGACFSSAVFAMIHTYSPWGLVAIFISGLIFAWVTWQTGSLWPAMLIHAVGNILTTLLVWWFYSSVSS